jgi:hypothetical protein
MIYVITHSDRGYRKWFYNNSILDKWGELMHFFRDKTIVEIFKSDTLIPQDFLRIRYNQVKYMMETK